MAQSLDGKKYSLWLMPSGEVYDRLALMVRQLSHRLGAPEFLPHVTLVGSFTGRQKDLQERCAELAAHLQPFVIRLGRVDFLDEYFRCVFVRAALTGPLRAAHQAACRVFGRTREPVFMPHLSLLYGNFPQSAKEQIIAELNGALDVDFRVKSLHLYLTQGEPLRWRKVQRFGLK